MPKNNHEIGTPEQLTKAGIQDTKQAIRNLDLLKDAFGPEGFARLFPELLHTLAGTTDPDMALNNLERFVSVLEERERFLGSCVKKQGCFISFMTIFGASRFLSSYLASTPEKNLEIIADPEFLSATYRKNDLSDKLFSFQAEVHTDAERYRTLRIFRKQEMLRIALRDLLGKADLQETVADLSALAECCLQTAYEWVDRDLQAKHGRPVVINQDGSRVPAGFAVIAMGKLGGRELNFSSDIDLMYVYSADGDTEGVSSQNGSISGRITNHEYFIKLSEKLTALIGEKTEDGFVFRVDLRLRPEGTRGPIAQSLGGYELYYESWGQTWERSALLKARPVAGDEAVGKEFMERIAPFVYRKYLDYSAIAEIREMKKKINQEVQRKGRTYRDVKLGYGGIREIEFVIQALQLLHAGRDKTLREKNALKALHLLSQKGLITYQEHQELSKAYVFLRTVEHRIQMLDDLQTQTMPSEESGLRMLARRSGYYESGRESQLFLRDYTAHTQAVRSIFENLFAFTGEEPSREAEGVDYGVLLSTETSEQEAVAALSSHGFRDAGKAFRNLVLLREGTAFLHQTPRSRKVFSELFPVIFGELIASPDPDTALNHMESYLAAQDSWDAFQSLVQQDSLVVKILVGIFANSDYFSRMLVNSPEMLEELLDSSRSAQGIGTISQFLAGLEAGMNKAAGVSEKLDAMRRFKHREEIRIGMADLLSLFPSPVVSRALSRLAEVCLDAALRLAVTELGRKYSVSSPWTGLAVIGVGKLGGREITYGSDLDILFVYSEEHAGKPPEGLTAFEYCSKIAEKIISYLTTMTREGFAYRVDTRLRPTGSKGPLVQSITAFRKYYEDHAETWERQALVNSRFVAGDRDVGQEFSTSLEGLVYRKADAVTLAHDIQSMRKRMEDELGKEDAAQYNIKQGYGGLVDIEFLAQYLQLVHGREYCMIRLPGTYNALRALRKQGLIGSDDDERLERAYLFLRLLESRMRIVANQATHFLARDPDRLRSLGRRMGYQDDTRSAGQKLLDDYERLRNEVREVFSSIVSEGPVLPASRA